MNPEATRRRGVVPKARASLARHRDREMTRLMRPVLNALLTRLDDREVAIIRRIDGLGSHLQGIEEKIGSIERRVQVLADNQRVIDERVSSVAAQAWDRQAVVRRLAALEDALIEGESQQPGPG